MANELDDRTEIKSRLPEPQVEFVRLRGMHEWPEFWRTRLRPNGATSTADRLKEQVREYWDRASCGTQVATGPKFSREYFEQIETHRYRLEPEIHAFAQFTRAHGK